MPLHGADRPTDAQVSTYGQNDRRRLLTCAFFLFGFCVCTCRRIANQMPVQSATPCEWLRGRLRDGVHIVIYWGYDRTLITFNVLILNAHNWQRLAQPGLSRLPDQSAAPHPARSRRSGGYRSHLGVLDVSSLPFVSRRPRPTAQPTAAASAQRRHA
jgi:hypothetical protein